MACLQLLIAVLGGLLGSASAHLSFYLNETETTRLLGTMHLQ